jgi:hypothetical protein
MSYLRFLARPVLLAAFASSAGACFFHTDEEDRGHSAPTTTASTKAARTIGAVCKDTGELVCALDTEGAAEGRVLVCQGGSFDRAFACGKGVACDTLEGHRAVTCGGLAVAVAGMPCEPKGAAACSPDRSSVQLCLTDTWVEGHHCAPAQCQVTTSATGPVVQCGADDAYSPGDFCSFPAEGGVCSTDHTSILVCEGGKTTLFQGAPCPEGQACHRTVVDGVDLVECAAP